MKFLGSLSLFTFICASHFAPASAQIIPPYPVTSDAKEYQITFGPNERNLKEISVFYVSSGNISTAAEIRLDGPVGIRGSVKTGFLGNEEPIQLLTREGGVQPAKVRLSKAKEQADFGLTPFSDDPRGGSAYAWFHLEKDACSGSEKDNYVAQLKLDLSNVDPSFYDLRFTVHLSLKEFKYSGTKASSIKPSSDGKYKGEPIILMSSIGDSEYVNVVSWNKKKIRSTKRIPVVKYVGYKGLSLSLARLNGVLNGGKSTFELSNGGDIYGVCFTAVKRRQSANGYPM